MADSGGAEGFVVPAGELGDEQDMVDCCWLEDCCHTMQALHWRSACILALLDPASPLHLQHLRHSALKLTSLRLAIERLRPIMELCLLAPLLDVHTILLYQPLDLVR